MLGCEAKASRTRWLPDPESAVLRRYVETPGLRRARSRDHALPASCRAPGPIVIANCSGSRIGRRACRQAPGMDLLVLIVSCLSLVAANDLAAPGAVLWRRGCTLRHGWRGRGHTHEHDQEGAHQGTHVEHSIKDSSSWMTITSRGNRCMPNGRRMQAILKRRLDGGARSEKMTRHRWSEPRITSPWTRYRGLQGGIRNRPAAVTFRQTPGCGRSAWIASNGAAATGWERPPASPGSRGSDATIDRP